MDIIKEIALFKNIQKIETLNLQSRCPNKYKVRANDKEYFVKIEDSEYTSLEMDKVRFLYDTYEKLEIPVIPLIDILTLKGKTVWIFPFFQGQTLSQANLPLDEYYAYGKSVAKDIVKLNKVQDDKHLFSILDLGEHFSMRKKQVQEFIENNIYDALKIYPKKLWQKILEYYELLYNKIKDNEALFNHNDIKLPNIMIDKNKNYYFIDLDPFDLTPIGYNVGYSISAFLFIDTKEKEKTFLRAFIREIDKDRKLLRQFNYFLISDFINKFPKYYNMYMENSKKIKKLLFNEDGYLEKELYEEN